MVSVIVVNWNTRELLKQTLESLFRATKTQLEVIVVDNASNDGSVEMVRAMFPQVVCIVNKSNLGFGKANNIGMQHSSGEYIFLLNSDTVMHDGALDTLVSYLATHPDIGMVGPKLLNSDGTFQHACRRRLPNPVNSFFYLSRLGKIFPNSRRLNAYKREAESPDVSGPVEAISGAAMLFRRNVYEATGGFDEQFFMYGEDLDLCKMSQDLGFPIHYVHSAVITHLGGQSSKKRALASLKNFYDAMWLYYNKHFRTSHPRVLRSCVRLGITLAYFLAVCKNMVKQKK